jgi:hypothetical protein
MKNLMQITFEKLVEKTGKILFFVLLSPVMRMLRSLKGCSW